MNERPRLVIFDVDGTLVDSRADIIGSMTDGFALAGLPAPDPEAVMGIVGLSLDIAVPRLAPDLPGETHARIVAAYKQAYMARRVRAGADHSPFYPGMRELIEELAAEPATILAIATGKSRRGLDALLENHAMTGTFFTTQCADDHPSKPNPSMILAALAETGIAADRAVMIGDASFDIDMAHAAGVRAIGVGWGFQPAVALAHAEAFVTSASELRRAIENLTGAAAA